MNKIIYISAGAAVAGIAAGFAAGWFGRGAKEKNAFEERVKAEVDQVQEYYKSKYAADVNRLAKAKIAEARDVVEDEDGGIEMAVTHEPEVVEEAEKIIQKMNYSQISKKEETTVKEVREVPDRNIFDNPPEVDPEDIRTPDRPYIITVDEFMVNEDERDQISLVFYDEDGVLVDERDSPITDIAGTVGLDSLTKFGHKSGDKKIVYVRNEKLGAEYEIVLDGRSYSEVVLGIKETKRGQKFRDDD